MRNFISQLVPVLLALVSAGVGQNAPSSCKQCAEWNRPQKPFRIFGNTYYVGPHGLSSILITSDAGHFLIDGALPESAPVIAANIRTLGFRIGEKVRFRPSGQAEVTGTITRYNKKTVTVITEDGEHWNVSPSFLSKLEVPTNKNVKTDNPEVIPFLDRSAKR